MLALENIVIFDALCLYRLVYVQRSKIGPYSLFHDTHFSEFHEQAPVGLIIIPLFQHYRSHALGLEIYFLVEHW